MHAALGRGFAGKLLRDRRREFYALGAATDRLLGVAGVGCLIGGRHGVVVDRGGAAFALAEIVPLLAAQRVGGLGCLILGAAIGHAQAFAAAVGSRLGLALAGSAAALAPAAHSVLRKSFHFTPFSVPAAFAA